MKVRSILTLLSVLLLLPLAQSPAQEGEFPDTAFFLGAYRLIGKTLDSSTTFLGRVVLRAEGDSLIAERFIGEEKWIGTWSLGYALGKEMRVLRMRYRQGDEDLEATYQWCVDFDNYPRLSGYLYHPKRATDDPGLEVLFFELGD